MAGNPLEGMPGAGCGFTLLGVLAAALVGLGVLIGRCT